eukprot:COSAG02_NODE_7586_length_2947_cov_2.376404_3_plen_102_part_00
MGWSLLCLGSISSSEPLNVHFSIGIMIGIGYSQSHVKERNFLPLCTPAAAATRESRESRLGQAPRARERARASEQAGRAATLTARCADGGRPAAAAANDDD